MEKQNNVLERFRAGKRQENSPKNLISLSKEIELLHGRIHEVQGVSADGFAAALVSRTKGSTIWIGRDTDVYSLSPLALARYFDPARLILTAGLTRKEILWASEQALRSKGFESVIIHLRDGPDLKESRRLQLAAKEGGSIGIILIEKGAQSSAAQTRWLCEPVPKTGSAINDHIWLWRQTKNKGGKCEAWQVRWKEDGYAAGYVDMVSRAAA